MRIAWGTCPPLPVLVGPARIGFPLPVETMLFGSMKGLFWGLDLGFGGAAGGALWFELEGIVAWFEPFWGGRGMIVCSWGKCCMINSRKADN
jgi:hypothetical protein